MCSEIMVYNEGLMAELHFSGETVLLWLAIALGVLFLGLLVLDRATRRRRRRRHRHEPETLGRKLRRPFSRMRALQGDLKQMFRERSQRDRGRGPRPPQTPW